MSYSTRNGKLEKNMPPTKEDVRTIKFHVIATATVRVKDDGSNEIVDAQLSATRTTTHPDDNLVERDLRTIMENSDALTELVGVLICERANRARNPKLVKPTNPLVAESNGA